MEAVVSDFSTSVAAVEDADSVVCVGLPNPVGDASRRTSRIMIVDDEPITIKVVRKYLCQGGYEDFVMTSDSTQAINMVREQNPDIVLLDLMMPDVDGISILQTLRCDALHAQTPVLVLTATDDRNLKRAALESGATDFLHKPVDPTDLVPRVRNALAAKAYQDQLKTYAFELEREVQRRTAEVDASRLELIYCLGRAAEYRDNETGRHVIRVGRYASIISHAMGLDRETISLLEQAAPLHDMGKIGIPDAVLLKPGRLDSDEMAVMRRHTEYGASIVSTMDHDDWGQYASHTCLGAELMQRNRSPVLKMAATIAMTHHEKWDGSGYPAGLRGEEIPIEGRITAVADVFDALSSKRPYKPALPAEKCFAIIEEGRGNHFDPRVVDAFMSERDAVLKVRVELADDEDSFRTYRQQG